MGLGRGLTWAARRTATFLTMAGARAPNEAGMDFWTLPKVMAPYLGEGGSMRPRQGWRPAPPTARPPARSPVQPEAVRGEEQVLGDVVAGDVSEDVARDHPHLGRAATHTAGAGEAGALGGAGAADRLPHQARQRGRRRPVLCGNMAVGGPL